MRMGVRMGLTTYEPPVEEPQDDEEPIETPEEPVTELIVLSTDDDEPLSLEDGDYMEVFDNG